MSPFSMTRPVIAAAKTPGCRGPLVGFGERRASRQLDYLRAFTHLVARICAREPMSRALAVTAILDRVGTQVAGR
jgi:hypothetical protein